MGSQAKTVLHLLMLLFATGLMLFVSLVGSSSVLFGHFSGFNFDIPSAAAGSTSVNPGWWVGVLTGFGVLASLAVSVLRAQDQNSPLDMRAFFRGMLYPQTFVALCVSPVVLFGALLGPVFS
jgi:hypothetical protein